MKMGLAFWGLLLPFLCAFAIAATELQAFVDTVPANGDVKADTIITATAPGPPAQDASGVRPATMQPRYHIGPRHHRPLGANS